MASGRSAEELGAAITSRLQDCPEVGFALLFGSAASGEPRKPLSDIDVAVYLDDALDGQQRWQCRLRLAAALAEARRRRLEEGRFGRP